MRDEERDKKMAIATTILQQLGGHKFVVMTGARDILALDSGLRFALPGTTTKNRINRVRIILEPTDTYNVSFWNFRKDKTKKISEHDMVYDDMLQEVFTAETGLDCRL